MAYWTRWGPENNDTQTLTCHEGIARPYLLTHQPEPPAGGTSQRHASSSVASASFCRFAELV